jgi:hypothetical protein
MPFTLAGSMIVDRAPEARSVAEVFIETDSIRVEWDAEEQLPRALLSISAGGERLDGQNVLPLRGRPASLSLAPPEQAEAREYAIVVYHQGLAVSDLHYLDRPEKLLLNWGDPWQSRFENPRLARLYDSPMGVFLHVGRYQVRLEVVGRPLDFGLAHIDSDNLTADVSARLTNRWSLTINGTPVELPLESCQFLERRLRSTQATEAPPPDRLNASTLGAVYRIKREDYPERVDLSWNYFPPSAPQIAGAVTEDAIMQPRRLSRDANTLQWDASAAIERPELTYVPPPPSPAVKLPPVVSVTAFALVLALGAWVALRLRSRQPAPRAALLVMFALIVLLGASSASKPTITDRQAASILEGLLHNIYRAFDYPDEEPTYDTLAQSITGDVLSETYLDVRRALEVERTGGARIRVTELVLDEAETTPEEDGFRATCRWTVSGSVAHWGHLHMRRNSYEADIEVRPVAGAWKVTNLNLTNQERL